MSVYIIAASLRSLWDKASFSQDENRMIKPLWGRMRREWTGIPYRYPRSHNQELQSVRAGSTLVLRFSCARDNSVGETSLPGQSSSES